jgi:hypothetical protein
LTLPTQSAVTTPAARKRTSVSGSTCATCATTGSIVGTAARPSAPTIGPGATLIKTEEDEFDAAAEDEEDGDDIGAPIDAPRDVSCVPSPSVSRDAPIPRDPCPRKRESLLPRRSDDGAPLAATDGAGALICICAPPWRGAPPESAVPVCAGGAPFTPEVAP